MNLKILYLHQIDNTIVNHEYERFVLYHIARTPQHHRGTCNTFELCNIDRIKELCGITHDLTKIKPFSNSFIFIFNGQHITIYDPSNLTPFAFYLYIDSKNARAKCEMFTQIIERCNNYVCYMQTKGIRIDNVPVNMNNYKIIKIIQDGSRWFDVLITLPTRNTLRKCKNYDGIICSIGMFKCNKILDDVMRIIIKLIVFMNIFQTYRNKYFDDKKTKVEIFSQYYNDDVAFMCVIEDFVHDFIYGDEI